MVFIFKDFMGWTKNLFKYPEKLANNVEQSINLMILFLSYLEFYFNIGQFSYMAYLL